MRSAAEHYFIPSVLPDGRHVRRFPNGPQETHKMLSDQTRMGCVACLVMFLQSFRYFGLHIRGTLMAHLSNCLCQRSLKANFEEFAPAYGDCRTREAST